MNKKMFINNIIIGMANDLNEKQLEKLRYLLVTNSNGIFDNTSECSSLSTNVDDNYSMLKKYSISKKIEQLADSTIYQYVRATKIFLEFTNKNYKDITYDDVLYYFSTLYGKIGSTAINDKRKYINSFFSWLLENEYISKNPFIKFKRIKCEQTEQDVLNPKEIEILRDNSIKSKNGVRDLAIIDFLLATGVRVSELVSLNRSDVDLIAGECSVYGKKTRKWRKVYLDAKALKHLIEYLNTRTDVNEALFVSYGRRMSKNNANKILRRASSNIKGKSVTVHCIRRTVATNLFQRNMPVEMIARLLGHSSAVCLKFYIKIQDDDIRHVYEKITA